MDRVVITKIAGADRTLNYSVEVMFDMADKYGTIQKALDLLTQNSREGFDALRWFAVRMSNDGELCRREAGHSRLPMLKEGDISPRMKPLDYETLKGAVVDAITLGYKREVENTDEEVDLGLLELREKKTKAGA